MYLLIKVEAAQGKLTNSAKYEIAGVVASEMGCESAAGIVIKQIDKPKAVVFIRGGCCHEVKANIPLEVDLFDVDNIIEGDEDEFETLKKDRPDIDKMYEEQTKGLKVVF